MKFFVPSIGMKIRLMSDWEFTLYDEYRNEPLYTLLSKKKGVTHVVSLPAGTVLSIERVYVRQTNMNAATSDDYDSITFKIVESKTRFWAKLIDANNIEFEHEGASSVKEHKEQLIAEKKKKDPITAVSVRKMATSCLHVLHLKRFVTPQIEADARKFYGPHGARFYTDPGAYYLNSCIASGKWERTEKHDGDKSRTYHYVSTMYGGMKGVTHNVAVTIDCATHDILDVKIT